MLGMTQKGWTHLVIRTETKNKLASLKQDDEGYTGLIESLIEK